jgi:hypothetical protein
MRTTMTVIRVVEKDEINKNKDDLQTTLSMD